MLLILSSSHQCYRAVQPRSMSNAVPVIQCRIGTEIDSIYDNMGRLTGTSAHYTFVTGTFSLARQRSLLHIRRL